MTFLVSRLDDGGPINGALVSFNSQEKLTNASGIVEYEDQLVGADLLYEVSSEGFLDTSGLASIVSENLYIEVVLQSITGITEYNAGIIIYPNPVNKMLYVQSDQMIYTLGIFDTSGRELISAEAVGISHAINISSFHSGIYLLRMEMEDGKHYRRVVIKK